MKRPLTIACIAILAMLFMVPPSAMAGKKDDTLNFALLTDLPTLDLYFAAARQGQIVARHIFDSLLYRDPVTGAYKPLLASSYKFIDNQTIDFELRQGVKFHNGQEFTADDVVYTLNWVSDPKNKVKNQNNVKWINRVEKLGKYKVRLHMKYPYPVALEFLAGPSPIYPHEYYAKVGPVGMGAKPIGTGPYRVTEVVPGRKVVFEKNTDYFKGSPKGQPHIGKLVMRVIPEQNTQIAELMSGTLDWAWKVPADQAEQLAKYPNINVVNAQTMRIGYLQFDAANRTGQNSPVTKLKVRQAIAHAIDRQAIINSLVKGASKIVNAACFPSQFGCTNDVAKYNYDPAKARKLLAEAGYPNGFAIDFYAYRDRPCAEAIMSFLQQVGIKAELHFLTYQALRDKVRKGEVAFDFMTWGSYSINDISMITSIYFKGENDDLARDPQVVKWLEVGDTSVDPQLRLANYKKALRRIAEQVYWLPLWSYNYNYAFCTDLVFTPTPDEIPRFFTAHWK